MLFIYDADCGFCMAAVSRLSRAFPRVEFRASREVDYAKFGLSRNDVRERAYLIVRGAGRVEVRGGGQAITGLLCSWGAGGRALSWLLSRLPLRVPIEAVYRVTARNRHRIPGAWAACDSSGLASKTK